MKLLNRQQRVILANLVELAGGPALVEQTLAALNLEYGRPPTLREVVERIVEKRGGPAKVRSSIQAENQKTVAPA